MSDNHDHRTRRAALVRAASGAVLVVFLLALQGNPGPARGQDSSLPAAAGVDITTRHAMVVTADSIASAVGNQVLLDGGNAVDAAVAVGFALAVTLPRAGNIGGGGFMLIRLRAGEEVFLDYREKAPLSAYRDMYLGEDDRVIEDSSTEGHLAVGVPGTVHGLAYAHQTYGTLPWKRLVAPAIRLASEGFVVSPSLAVSLAEERKLLAQFEETKRIFVTPDYQTGNRMVQADLASTLERISSDWTDFYRGETARLIVAEMKRHGGLVKAKDLEQYTTKVREPVSFAYKGYRVVSAPLPSSGGVLLSMLFKMLEQLDVSSCSHFSTAYIHLLSEAEKIAYRGRALYLGDSDFYPSPWEQMTSGETILRLSRLIRPNKKLSVKALEAEDLLPSWKERSVPTGSGGGRGQDRQPQKPFTECPEQTTHYSIVDRWGNAVASTYTLNASYGSGVVVKGAGFLLNNEMDDFSIKPGHPNLYGLMGSEANAIEPGKRMLSSMAPAMVLEGPELRLILGTPGGSTIPTTVLQVILNVIDYGMPLGDAVSAGRFHEQYLPDRIYVENGALEPGVIDALLDLGHKIEIRKPIGNVQAVYIKNGKLNGVSDPRGSGRAVGY